MAGTTKTASCICGITVARDSGMFYPLTSCCRATGKGAEVETGTVCRSCYREVDPTYGDGCGADHPDVDAYLLAWLGVLGCVDPPAHSERILADLTPAPRRSRGHHAEREPIAGHALDEHSPLL